MPVPAHTLLMAAGGGAAGPALPAAVIALSPSVYYKVDEGSGNAIDYSGNGLDSSTFDGATRQSIAGPYGSYAEWDGTNADRLNRVDDSSFSASSTGMSLFALIYPHNLSVTRLIMSKRDNTLFEWQFTATSASKLQNVLFPSGGATNIQNELSDSAVISLNAWQAVGFTTPNRSTGTRGKLFYNSGTPIASSTAATSGSWSDTAAQFFVGCRGTTSGTGTASTSNQWAGGIGHVAMWDTELSESDMGSLMSAADADGWF
jgi:hypothetical protein